MKDIYTIECRLHFYVNDFTKLQKNLMENLTFSIVDKYRFPHFR